MRTFILEDNPYYADKYTRYQVLRDDQVEGVLHIDHSDGPDVARFIPDGGDHLAPDDMAIYDEWAKQYHWSYLPERMDSLCENLNYTTSNLSFGSSTQDYDTGDDDHYLYINIQANLEGDLTEADAEALARIYAFLDNDGYEYQTLHKDQANDNGQADMVIVAYWRNY